LCITCAFILIRICLSLPMYCTLCFGMNPIYRSNHNYQRIDSNISTQHHRRMQQQQQQSQSQQYQGSNEYEETQEDRVQRQIRRQWRLMEMERRQMELAIAQSRRDAFQSTRKQQDEEYQRALKEAEEADMSMAMAMTMNEEKDEIVHNSTLSQEETNSDEIKTNGLDNYDHASDTQIEEDIKLETLPIECVDDDECVYVRIRLPNGIRSERRFHFSSTVKDVVLWCKHLFVEHGQTHLMNNFQIISTMPHTVYDDMEKNMKDLKFWYPHSKRKLVSPLLYVDEL